MDMGCLVGASVVKRWTWAIWLGPLFLKGGHGLWLGLLLLKGGRGLFAWASVVKRWTWALWLGPLWFGLFLLKDEHGLFG